MYVLISVNNNPNTTNTDEYFKIGKVYGFLEHKSVTVLCSIVSNAIYCSTICIVIVIIMYYNVLITSYLSNMTSKVKSSKIKEPVSVSSLLVRFSKYVVNFSKVHI